MVVLLVDVIHPIVTRYRPIKNDMHDTNEIEYTKWAGHASVSKMFYCYSFANIWLFLVLININFILNFCVFRYISPWQIGQNTRKSALSYLFPMVLEILVGMTLL